MCTCDESNDSVWYTIDQRIVMSGAYVTPTVEIPSNFRAKWQRRARHGLPPRARPHAGRYPRPTGPRHSRTRSLPIPTSS
jgi:hypothetical protein